MFTQISLVLVAIFCVTNGQLMFRNPILDRNSADPAIIRIGNFYYLTLSENVETELTIYKSPILTDFRNAPSVVAYRTPPGYSDLWASEMHLVDGQLYLHFTMRTTNVEWRMYVMKARDPNDPMAGWEEPMRMIPEWDAVAIDGTIMKHGDRLYYVWSSGVTGRGSIYIAPMVNPTAAVLPHVMIKHPTEDWECQDICTSEGPYFIYNRNVSYLIFSASMTWNPNYCLTQMSIPFDRDPMDPNNWDHVGGPVFTRNDEESVYTTGHAAFTTSPGKNDYLNLEI